MNENLLYILKNKKKSQGQYYYYNKYNREIKNRNFEENKNSPFEINEINGGINIKSHEQIYSLNQNKYGFFPNEVDLNFEKNNTLLNDKNIQAYDENIYKEILFQNSKKSEKRTIKIIKCEKINSSNRNNIFTNNKEKVNDNIIDKNRNKLNSDNKLILKKFKSQDFIDGQLFKNNSNSFAKKSQGIDNNFRKTLPRTNNNVLINKIIRRELSENNQKFNYISNNTQKDIFNTTDKKDIDKEKNLIKRNKLSETRNKEKTIKKIIKNEKYTSSKTTKENTMKNTLENTMKSEYKINKSNRVKSDDDYNHSSILSNQPSSKGFLGSLDNLNIYKKENKRSNIFNEKNINEINKNLFNERNNNSKINPKNNEIIFTKKKITLSNNKEKRKKYKKIYQKSIIKNNNFNLNKYKTLDDKTNTLKDESKNRINDIKIINNNFRYTEKEILFNKINNNKNGNKNIKKNKSKNKVINHINLNKNRNKQNFINKSDKNSDVVSISQKMNKYSSIKNITIEDINSKSIKNLSKSNDFSSYSNIKNNSSRENINKINYMSYNVDSNILFTNNKEKNNINNTNKINNNKKRNIENEKIKLKKNIHLDKKDEDKNSKKSNKMNKDNKNRTIINYIYNNNSINENKNFSNKNNTDFKNSNNILLKSCINQEGRQLDEKAKNMNELFCSNSKDSEFINDNISSTKEIIKEINEQCLSNIQVNSYESQFISNLNPNSNTFSCSNKSEIKLNNKINFDMPINIDLEKIEIDESKEGPKNKSNKLKKENKTKNDVIKKDIQQNNSRLEKLDNFINQLNDEDESNDDEEEEEEEEEEKGEEKGEGEEPKEKIFIQNNKIVNYNSDLPTNGLSIEELKVSKDNTNNNNGGNKNDTNTYNNCGIDRNGKENKANNINNENIKLYNFDLESKGNENDNKENNFSNNGFYDDINININNKINEVEKNDTNYNEKRFNIGDMNIDSPHSDQEFLGNLELIQKNNNKNCLNEKELSKNNNIINNNNMKEIESEYEFNLSNEKFYKPLNKYENAFNFDKINLFKS